MEEGSLVATVSRLLPSSVVAVLDVWEITLSEVILLLNLVYISMLIVEKLVTLTLRKGGDNGT